MDKQKKIKKSRSKKTKKSNSAEIKKLLDLIEKLVIKPKGELEKQQFPFNKSPQQQGGVYLASQPIVTSNPFVQSGFLQQPKDVSNKELDTEISNKLKLLIGQKEREERDKIKEKIKRGEFLTEKEKLIADWIDAVPSELSTDYEPSLSFSDSVSQIGPEDSVSQIGIREHLGNKDSNLVRLSREMGQIHQKIN